MPHKDKHIPRDQSSHPHLRLLEHHRIPVKCRLCHFSLTTQETRVGGCRPLHDENVSQNQLLLPDTQSALYKRMHSVSQVYLRLLLNIFMLEKVI